MVGLSPAQAQSFDKKKMHGTEEVWNVLMIEMKKCIYVYIVLIELWTRSPNKEVEILKCF